MAHSNFRKIALPWPLRLTGKEIQKLHEGSLVILDRTGLQFEDQEALDLFKKAGATISDGNRVHIDGRLVEWALGCAPKNVVIYDRDGKPAMDLGDGRCYYGPGSDCANLYDPETGVRRKAVMDDVIKGIRLADALPNIDFLMSMVLPSDVPLGSHEIHQLAAMLSGTAKPVIYVGESEQSTVSAIEMAAAVAGDERTLADKPFIINFVSTISGLKHNAESVRRLLYAAGKNLPSIYQPAHTRGTVGPMTTAGAVALANAGQMAGLVLSQLKKEGSPFIRSHPGGEIMDLRTMVDLYVGPDDGMVGWDLARSQGLPMFGTAGCSESKILDAQAASEAALSLFNHTINGANLIHDMGYLDCAMTYSFELLVLCDEIVGWLKKYLQSPRIDDDALALDVIHDAAMNGNGYFLESPHTMKHMREDWQPSLFDRSNFHQWDKKGGRTFEERAREMMTGIMEEHRGNMLPDDIAVKVAKVRDKYAPVH